MKDKHQKWITVFGIVSAVLIGGLLIFLLWPVIAAYAVTIATMFTDSYRTWAIFGFGIALFAVILLFFRYIFPIITYTVSKLVWYLRLSILCKRLGYQMRVTRPPFASLFGVGKRPDVEVVTSDKTYRISLVDFVYRHRRAFLWIDENRYCIAPISLGGLKRGGHFLGGSMGSGGGGRNFGNGSLSFYKTSYEIDGEMNRTKEIPPREARDGCLDLLVLSREPLAADCTQSTHRLPLCSGDRIGNTVFLHNADMKRFLKNEMHIDIE